MQFSSLFTIAVATMLSAPALACKCTSGSNNEALTKSCCGQLSGTVNGNDCAASSISEHLSNFRSCCGGQSDCDYPSKRDVEGATTTIVVK